MTTNRRIKARRLKTSLKDVFWKYPRLWLRQARLKKLSPRFQNPAEKILIREARKRINRKLKYVWPLGFPRAGGKNIWLKSKLEPVWPHRPAEKKNFQN